MPPIVSVGQAIALEVESATAVDVDIDLNIDVVVAATAIVIRVVGACMLRVAICIEQDVDVK